MSHFAEKLARVLGLSKADAALMALKAILYQQAADSIQNSELSHEKIAKEVGTSRARITRIANSGENSVSMELLIKIIVILEGKVTFKLAI